MRPVPLVPLLAALAALAALTVAPGAAAHACYVSDAGPEACRTLHPDAGVLARGLSNPLVALLLVATLAAPFVAFAVWRLGLDRAFAAPWARMRETLRSYEDLLPWMLRLSLGISLAAAGTVGYFISPLEGGDADPLLVRGLFFLGFLFLLGFLVRPAAVVVFALYAFGLAGGVAVPHFLLGVSEVAAAALALAVLGGGRPGLDHLVQNTLDPRGRLGAALTRRPGPLGRATVFTPVVLRVGLAVTMLYGAATEKLLNPGIGVRVAEEHGLTAVLPAAGWVVLVGVAETLIALLFLVGFLTRPTSVAAFGVLTATMVYFGESLTSHVTLFGVVSWLFVTGSGPLSVDRWLNPEAGRGGSKLKDVPRAVPD